MNSNRELRCSSFNLKVRQQNLSRDPLSTGALTIATGSCVCLESNMYRGALLINPKPCYLGATMDFLGLFGLVFPRFVLTVSCV